MFHISDFIFQISYSRFQISYFILHISDYKFQNSDVIIQVSKFKLQISYFIFHIRFHVLDSYSKCQIPKKQFPISQGSFLQVNKTIFRIFRISKSGISKVWYAGFQPISNCLIPRLSNILFSKMIPHVSYILSILNHK